MISRVIELTSLVIKVGIATLLYSTQPNPTQPNPTQLNSTQPKATLPNSTQTPIHNTPNPYIVMPTPVAKSANKQLLCTPWKFYHSLRFTRNSTQINETPLSTAHPVLHNQKSLITRWNPPNEELLLQRTVTTNAAIIPTMAISTLLKPFYLFIYLFIYFIVILFHLQYNTIQ